MAGLYGSLQKRFCVWGIVACNSHNTDIISNELLRPDCYFELKDNRISPFCNLTGKALREAHNLQKMYKAGAFNE